MYFIAQKMSPNSTSHGTIMVDYYTSDCCEGEKGNRERRPTHSGDIDVLLTCCNVALERWQSGRIIYIQVNFVLGYIQVGPTRVLGRLGSKTRQVDM